MAERPPSFEPGSRRRPPRADDAVVVGRPARPAQPARRVPPATPRRPGAQGAAPPPAIPPGDSSARPARPASGTARTAAGAPARPAARPAAARRPRRRGRRLAVGLVIVLALLLAWPIGLGLWANNRLTREPALSGAAGTPGTTYLLAGSDERGSLVHDATAGSRTDTIMVLHVPPSGPSALISLPRDTYVDIPGHGPNKLNAAYAFGGPPLLVTTVEGLTGLTVDHYVEIGLDGVAGVVDAVGGVELCLDYDVDDAKSKLVWTAGCHEADGITALAFARMRYSDPQGDIGRTQRQQQLISAVGDEVAQRSLLWQPGRQVSLLRAGTDALVVSEGTSILDLGRLALAFRDATGPEGIRGTPPIADVDYQPGGVGSTVLLDPERSPGFWAGIRDGSLPPGPVGGLPS